MSVLGKVAVTRNASTGSLVVGLKDDGDILLTWTLSFFINPGLNRGLFFDLFHRKQRVYVDD
jgi:hypothetical protein